MTTEITYKYVVLSQVSTGHRCIRLANVPTEDLGRVTILGRANTLADAHWLMSSTHDEVPEAYRAEAGEQAAVYLKDTGPKALLMWAYEDAPNAFQAISGHEDVDWIALVPPGYDNFLILSGLTDTVYLTKEFMLPGGAKLLVRVHS